MSGTPISPGSTHISRNTLHLLSGNSGEVPRGETMLYAGTDPETYITEYISVYEENTLHLPTSRTSAVIDLGWEGYRESGRCSRDTSPESYFTKYTSIRKKLHMHTALQSQPL